MATPRFEEIAADFEFLDEWEDRYRYVIELGRAMPPLDDALKVPATKVEGCASQVWIVPRIDGLEVLREIKSSPDLSDIPCVVLTTSRAEGDMVKAYRLHANSYLVKPGSYENFAALMAEIERYWLRQNSRPVQAAG